MAVGTAGSAGLPARPAAKRRWVSRYEGWFFIFPWVIGFVLLDLVPYLFALVISFTRAAPRLSPEISPATIAIVKERPGIEVMLSPPVVQRRLVRTNRQAGHRHKLSRLLSSNAYEG